MPAAPANSLPQVVSIKVAGTALSNARLLDLVEARISQAMSIADRCVLHFTDENFELMDDSLFTVNKAVTVSFLDFQGSEVQVFDGEITAIGVEQGRSARHEFVVEAYDKSHRLGHTATVRTFLKQNYQQMIQKIAQEAGLQADISGSGLTSPTFEYMMQQSSDFAFLDRIAWRTGTEWFVSGSKLTFRDRPSGGTAATLKFGENLSKFRARYSGTEHIKKVTVRGWDPTTKQAVTAENTAATSSPPNSSNPSMLSAARGNADTFNGALRSNASVIETTAEATKVSAALAARQATAELIVKGEAIGTPSLKAGTMITISQVGTKLGGNYYLTEVEHVFGRQGDLTTRFTAGGLQNAALVDLLGGGGEEVGPWGREGLVVGIVTNNKDPDKLARVKVKFPTLSDQEESTWARLVTVGAGTNRGWQVIPDVNDEVVVGFEHGDLRRPYVLGGVWNKTTTPPVASDQAVGSGGDVESWTVRTRLGHVLSFLDGTSDDKKAFSVVLADGKTKVHLGQDKVQVISNNKVIELDNGKASIVIKDNGDILIKGANITLEGTGTVKVDAKSGVELKSATTMKLEASATLEAKANASVKVEASGILELKGSMAKIN